MNVHWHLALLAMGSAVALQASAAPNGPNATELTPAGALKGGNQAGSIPAWHGNDSQQAGWSFGKLRADHWKYNADRPIYSIDSSTVERHVSTLSPGQVELLRRVKGYRMDVYPTRRGCGVPDFVANNTRSNASIAAIAEDGWSIKEAMVPGFPFPTPTSGVQAMWNAKLRYRGFGIHYTHTTTAVSPRRGSGEWIRAGQEFTMFIPWGGRGATKLSTLPSIEYQGYGKYSSPTALAGQALAITIPINRPGSDAFYYFPGQRRVRRMPSYSYDSPQIGMENQYTLDEPFVFNGTMDRFDWKLVGKREMLVPYNAFGAYDFKGKWEDIAKADSIDPAWRRYELHRVWVVEATVKQGMRHTAPKRTFYLDEDSWVMLMAEDYDAQGELAKVREAFPIPVFETGTCDASAFVQYNVKEGRYLFDMHAAGTGVDMKWEVEGRGARWTADFYTADNLRAVSER